MKSQKINRKIGLDLLRVTSILYIVGFWHMLNYTNAIPLYNNIVTYRITWIILGTFMFLSGYFIGKKRVEINKKSLQHFYTNRVLRIYPLYFLTIILFTFLGLSDSTTSIKASLLISSFLGPSPPTLWFITILMTFYASAPFLMLACEKIKIGKLLAIYIVITVLLLLCWRVTHLLDIRIIVYLPAFTFGLYISNHDIKISQNKLLFAISLSLGTILSFTTNNSHNSFNMLLATPMITVVSVLLYTVFNKFSVQNKKINISILIMSYASYGMYLFHRPIYMIFKRLYFPESNIMQIVYLVTVCLPIIVLLSYIIQKSYDTTIKMLTRRYTRTK